MPDYGSYTSPAAGITTTRTGRLFSQVQVILGSVDPANLKRVFNILPAQLIYDKLDEGQVRLASDLLCLEKSATLTVTSGTTTEPTGFYRAKLLKLPTGQWLQLEEVDIDNFDLLERNVIGTAEQTPLYFKRWNGTITFWPSPGSASYTLYYYGIPTTSIEQAVEPEVPAYMDQAILYWAVKELAPIANRTDLIVPYSTMWEQENFKLISRKTRTKTAAVQIANDVYA